MNIIFLIMIFGLFTVGIISSSTIFGKVADSSRKQMAMGSSAENFVCKSGSYNNTVGAFHDFDETPAFFIIGPDGLVERINGPQPATCF